MFAGDRIPPVAQLVAQSIPDQNTLLLLTESLNLPLVISQFILHSDPRTLCLFLDVDEMEILQINSHLARLKEEAVLVGLNVNMKAKIESINFISTKRKMVYQSFGFYAVSSVVFVLDLLCHVVLPSLVGRIWVKDAQRVKLITHNYAWALEMLQRESKNSKSIIVSRSVCQIGRDSLLDLHSIFAVKHVIIWPFGRKQIMDALKTSPEIEEYEHNVQMDKVKKTVQEILLLVMKEWATGMQSQRNLLQVYTKEMYVSSKGSRHMMDMYHLRVLMFKLCNESYVGWLFTIYRFLNTSEKNSLWATSNQRTDNQIDFMKRTLFNEVFQFRMCEGRRKVSVTRQDKIQYEVKYQMEVKLPYSDKVVELHKTLQKYIEKTHSETNRLGESRTTHRNVWIFVPPSMRSEDLITDRYYSELRKVYRYLKQSEQERNWYLRNIVKRNPKTKVSNNDLCKQNQVILLEEFLSELQTYNPMADQYQILLESASTKAKRLELMNQFAQRVEAQKFRYINSERLLEQLDIPPQIHIRMMNNDDLFSANQFRQHQPDCIVFFSPCLKMLRNVYLIQSQLQSSQLRQIHNINITDSIEEGIYKHRIIKEDNNFWEISKARPTLPVINADLWSRVNKLVPKDLKARQASKSIINQVDASRMHVFNIDSTTVIPDKKFYIVIDKREFKSELPSVLFHYGFEIVPVFLTVSDYILTDSISVERKSVTTHDLHQSLRTGRLDSQLKNMSQKVKSPYLLIQFSHKIQFNLRYLSESFNRATNETYSSNTRRQVIQLLKKYPKVIPIWSANCTQTAQLFYVLKENKQQPDINSFVIKESQKQETELNVQLVSKLDEQMVI